MAGGGVGVAGRQGDHRRHPSRRNCLVHELIGGDRPGRAVVVLEVQGAGGAVPGDVQHVGRAAVQFGPDRRRGGERHHPDVGGVLAGGADRGQHVPQFPLIIQHRPAAVGGGDRHHDPQRPRQHAPRCRIGLPVEADQRVQRQRAAAIGARQSLPRQPAQLRRHGQAEPHRLMRPLRRRQHPPQLAENRHGQEGLPQQPGGPAQRQLTGGHLDLCLGADRHADPGPGTARLVDRLGQA